MFGFHWAELVVVLVAGLAIFGPKRLPEIGRAAGQTINTFKKGIREIDEPDEVHRLSSTDQTVRATLNGQDASGNTTQTHGVAGPGAS